MHIHNIYTIMQTYTPSLTLQATLSLTVFKLFVRSAEESKQEPPTSENTENAAQTQVTECAFARAESAQTKKRPRRFVREFTDLRS
jgi:hypothetical protein